jgi:hypothetical protein
MSDSVLGLGAAALGAGALGAGSLGASRAVRKARKYKKEQGARMVKTPMPSFEDFQQGVASTRNQKNLIDGPILGGTGDFYYREAPKKIPEGSFIVQGPSINTYPYRNPQEGSTRYNQMPTYQLVTPTVNTQQAPVERTPIATGAGRSADFFGGADYKQARAQGYSNKQILKHLDQNQNLLRGNQAAGGGGIYDRIKQKVERRAERRAERKAGKR